MAAILADDIFNCIFLNENESIQIQISLKYVPRRPTDNKPALLTRFNDAIYVALGGDGLTHMDWLKSQQVITRPIKCGMKLLVHSKNAMPVQLKIGMDKQSHSPLHN